MLFNSVDFALFFIVIYALYRLLGHRGQNRLLLVGSYFFYGCWDYRFLSLIVLSTAVDFWVGKLLPQAPNAGRRKLLLGLSLLVNLGTLGIFKYFDFFALSLQGLVRSLGYEVDVVTLQVVLPVGISFYTFQTLGYTLDVYWRKQEPVQDPWDFALYVAFFPQLVAGPIERASHLLPQLIKPRRVEWEDIRTGAWLILLGLYKKVVIADTMGSAAGRLFEQPGSQSGTVVLFSLYAFAFQIYGDFSGYTDIARGVSRLLGVKLMDNFRVPYLATNPSEFWRRWHVSLSTWLRDYLYVPLGGNRLGTLKTYRNLMTTMVLGGLWHGAAWNFVAWGGFHGAILCIHRRLRRGGHLREHNGWSLRKVFFIVLFFHVTCFGWLLFGVKQLTDVPTFFSSLLIPELSGARLLLNIVVVVSPLLIYDYFQYKYDDVQVVKRWPKWARAGVYAVALLLLVLVGQPGGEEFIYFQF